MKYESITNMIKKVIVYGGHSSLGATCIKHLINKNWWVANVDYSHNQTANFNVVIPHVSWTEQENFVVETLNSQLNGEKVYAVICLANGLEKGNATSGLGKQVDYMTKKCVWGSTISSTIATRFLCTGGLFVLHGSINALSGTPDRIGHGMANAAVHHLTKTLANPHSGMPGNSTVLAVLPDTLDTDENRKWKPLTDFSNFTPVGEVAELLEKWIEGQRPPSGSLICIATRNKQTAVMRVLSEAQMKEKEWF